MDRWAEVRSCLDLVDSFEDLAPSSEINGKSLQNSKEEMLSLEHIILRNHSDKEWMSRPIIKYNKTIK